MLCRGVQLNNTINAVATSPGFHASQ